MPRGHTLLELATFVALFASTLAILSPTLNRHRDTAAVLAARESVAGLIAQARVAAVARGGAEVRMSTGPSTASLIVRGDPVRVLRFEEETDVVVDLGGRVEVVLSYDEMGLGRLASATLRFRRGTSERILVVSSYGRVRRR